MYYDEDVYDDDRELGIDDNDDLLLEEEDYDEDNWYRDAGGKHDQYNGDYLD